MFHFTIRDLLWLTVVVALAVAWWIDRGRMEERFREKDKAFQALVTWLNDGTVVKLGGSGEPSPLASPDSTPTSTFPGFNPRFNSFGSSDPTAGDRTSGFPGATPVPESTAKP